MLFPKNVPITHIMPTEKLWAAAAYWDAFYAELLAAPPDNLLREGFIYRKITQLDSCMVLLAQTWQWKATSILDAGCGISLLPFVLQYWGFDVTALDTSAVAIKFLEQQKPTEVDLAKCIEILEPHSNGLSATVIRDINRTLPELRKRQCASGKLQFIHSDWNTPALPPATFDLIFCQHGFRYGNASFIRQALGSFYNLLKPGGVFYANNINISPQLGDQISALVTETGFRGITGQYDKTKKYGMAIWGTG